MRDVDHIRVMMTRVDLSNTFDPQLMAVIRLFVLT